MYNSLPQRRQRAVAAWQQVTAMHACQPHYPNCLRDAARLCGERCRFVTKWVGRYSIDPTDAAFQDKHRSGRPRKAEYAAVAELVHDPDHPSSFRHAARRSMSALREQVSASTVKRAVHEQGWRKHKRVKGAILSQERKLERKKWASKHARPGDWNTTICIDSTVIQYDAPATLEHGRWGPRGERVVRKQHGSQLHVYAGASPSGLSSLHECTGTTGLHLGYGYRDPARLGKRRVGVGADEARDVIEAIIKECLQCMTARDKKHAKILLDRATPHTSAAVREWLHSHGYDDFYLPAPGCDINWMDWTMWHTLKQDVYAQASKYETFEQFRIMVHKVWAKMRDECKWRWLSRVQATRVAKIAKDGAMMH